MVATASPTPSMNAPSEKDPFNNNCYGTTVDRAYKMVSLPVLDVKTQGFRLHRRLLDIRTNGQRRVDPSSVRARHP